MMVEETRRQIGVNESVTAEMVLVEKMQDEAVIKQCNGRNTPTLEKWGKFVLASSESPVGFPVGENGYSNRV